MAVRQWFEKKVGYSQGWDWLKLIGVTEAHIAESNALLLPTYARSHLEYQPFLYGLLRALQASTVVETGVNVGCSTYYALHGLAANGGGTLYSCDPMWRDGGAAKGRFTLLGWSPKDVAADWKFFGEISKDALPKIPTEPKWDVFIHDSDHGYDCMLAELRYAWPRVRPGGAIVVDDHAWGRIEYSHAGTDEHWALRDFLDEVEHAGLGLLCRTTAVVLK